MLGHIYENFVVLVVVVVVVAVKVVHNLSHCDNYQN